jgi:hypothetical protein
MKQNAVKMIEPRQIKRIHVLLSVIGITDESYRWNLSYNFGVTTCKDLSYESAEELIDSLESFGEAKGVLKRSKYRSRFNDLKNRPDMANPEQLRKIEVLWKMAMGIDDDEKAQRTLRTFLFRHFHVSDLRFLDRWKVNKVIHALRCINERREQKTQGPPEMPQDAFKWGGIGKHTRNAGKSVSKKF